MKLVGLMPCRNEEWIIGLSARAALLWCDALIVVDHWSTDATPDILKDLQDEYGPQRVWFYGDRDYEWREMEQRQMLLEVARSQGATHIAIIDADEILSGNLLTIDDPLSNDTPLQRSLPWMPRGHILQLPGYNMRGARDVYHSNGIWGNRWFSVAFADDPRLNWSGDRFHHREPMGLDLKPYRPIAQGQGGVMHLWGASERRLKAKHALYKLTERLRWPEKPNRELNELYGLWLPKYSDGFPGAFKEAPESWWAPYEERGWLQYLDVDAEPWQIAEVKNLIEIHGRDRFKGLDLFGVENE